LAAAASCRIVGSEGDASLQRQKSAKMLRRSECPAAAEPAVFCGCGLFSRGDLCFIAWAKKLPPRFLIRNATMRTFLTRLLLAVNLAGSSALAAGGGKVEFNRDIRPILSDNCFYCHGPDKNRRKSGLRLDVREEAIKAAKSGDTAIVPGDPAKSQLLSRLASTDEEEVMPPPDTHKSVTPAQRELFRRWIEQGAEYQPHWAYITPRRPMVPAVKNASWVKNPIDAFILANLEAKDITPSGEADARVLIRRLSLDLIGLPPTPQEVDAFVRAGPPGDLSTLIDRLLASPHFGERMAVPWLDVVRYADTVGYHGDQNVNVFAYRDYVIDAFNANKPFDQFTVEQLAGDLLPKPTPEQLTATCFNRLNMMTREGGAQPKEYLAKYAADRVRTVSGAWLGSTMGCNECHDHKFDPFTAKDFYALAAFFGDVKQWGVYNDYSYTPNPDLKGWSNDHPFPPEIEVTSNYLRLRGEKLRAQEGDLAKAAAEKAAPQFADWRKVIAGYLQNAPSGWSAMKLIVPEAAAESTTEAAEPVPESDGENAEPVAKTEAPPKAAAPPKPAPPAFRADEDGSAVFARKSPAKTTLEFSPNFPALAALRIELLPRAEYGGTIFRGSAKRTTLKIAATLRRKGADKDQPLAFRAADADIKEPRYENGFEIVGVKDGWGVGASRAKEPHVSTWLLDQPQTLAEGDTISVALEGNTFGCLRVAASPLAPLDLQKAGMNTETTPLAWLRTTAFDGETYAKIKELDRQIADCREGRAKVLVTERMEPLTTRVLPRGNWQDESGEIVAPAVPHFLLQPAKAERLSRLDLAQWLVAPENPLTARVFVNRLWKQFFGTGISAVVDDLGAQGEWPVHPELLDWLAVEFRESGWDVKHMVKLIVMSATYRQDANLRSELRDRDPNNRWLASQNPRRLEAEFVRDNALAIAGLLNPDLGGPPVHPYQPARYYENLQFPDRDYHASQDDRQYRRGLYTHWQRTFLHPMLANFDAPSREECTAARTVANTPQQALTLLNDPSFVEAARTLATRLLTAAGDSDEARLALAYDLALARPIKPREQESLRGFLAEQRAYYEAHRDDAQKLARIGNAPPPAQIEAAELAAWTTVARVVLNLHETITRY
jgi:hypothetical protein